MCLGWQQGTCPLGWTGEGDGLGQMPGCRMLWGLAIMVLLLLLPMAFGAYADAASDHTLMQLGSSWLPLALYELRAAVSCSNLLYLDPSAAPLIGWGLT